ncbi:MarR family transcriptional regulator [Streptomyces sp. ID05-04B]|uniref:MarR family transcriptional regulator n=1 Tax=unclassified Streptomyces TaxID=2593676 RepID=UPI000D19C1EF|nr:MULTISPECIES: MarR family transcriptional regulator [unclassified Streptomyces]AVV44514.1 MarR family transcriptional regulator [Streptomyces sp. P3]MDX5567291.1 MarR family transcriptional regulator [Streptomyces sp. ID05-04B]
MTTAESGATGPVADARALGLAHYAARGVLEHVLSRHGITFQQIVLRAAVTADTPRSPDDLVAQVCASLKADPADIRAALGELLAGQLLVVDGAHLRPTAEGRDLLTVIGSETAPLTARIWGGIPAEDLAAAGRVLTLVAERADAQHAALSAEGPNGERRGRSARGAQ